LFENAKGIGCEVIMASHAGREYGLRPPCEWRPVKITELMTRVDDTVFQTSTGPMAWGTVEIFYVSDGLEPQVTVKVPIPVYETQSDEERRAETLRRARKLIDHACVTMPPAESSSAGEMLEGLSEELGILPPTTKPKRSRRA
jgi:hypothetical protein